MEKYDLKNKSDIKLHNVLYAITSEIDYEMNRLLLLKKMPDCRYDEYVLVEGYHCSCYDFDETNWECTKLSSLELTKLLSKTYKSDNLRNKLKKYLEYYSNWDFNIDLTKWE